MRRGLCCSCGFEPRFHFDRSEQLQHTGAGPFKITSLGGDSAEKLQKASARGVVTSRFREVTVRGNLSILEIEPYRTQKNTLGVEISNLSFQRLTSRNREVTESG